MELDSLKGYILAKKSYLMALQKSLSYIRIDYALKSDKEKNDIDITEYEIQTKINSVKRIIQKLEVDFEHQHNAFLSDLKDIEDNYEETLELAKKLQSKDIRIKHLLHSVNWKTMTDNINNKIAFYKELKELLNK